MAASIPPPGGLSKVQASSLTRQLVSLWELGAAHPNGILPREVLLTQHHVVLVHKCVRDGSASHRAQLLTMWADVLTNFWQAGAQRQPYSILQEKPPGRGDRRVLVPAAAVGAEALPRAGALSIPERSSQPEGTSGRE